MIPQDCEKRTMGGVSLSRAKSMLMRNREREKEDGGSGESRGTGEGGRTDPLLPDGEDHLVDGLEDVGLEHERLLDLVEHGLGLVERSAVEGDV